MTSSLRREEPKPAPIQAPPPRRCIICCDEKVEPKDLMKPCRTCKSDWCKNCLQQSFEAAVYDHNRMPPKCCTLLQLHTAIRYMFDEEVKLYREKFEEWLTPKKTYCPSPICSAFISERLLPSKPPTPPQSPASPVSPLSSRPQSSSLKPVILEVLDKVSANHVARFFRGELPITELPGFTRVIQKHMDLSIIRGNIDHYRSMSDVTADMNLIVSNAIDYNGPDHPVTNAAHQLNNLYNIEMADAMDRMIQSPIERRSEPLQFFPCPKCHIAICTSCHQIEHGNEPCDDTVSDAEIAMLRSFGYKRCPRCNAGVKKMYGCSHIQCHCGAHWCYYCQKSTGECDGGCADRDDDDEGDYDSDEISDMDDEEGDGAEAVAQVNGITTTAPPLPQPGTHTPQSTVLVPPPSAPRISNATLTIPNATERAISSAPVPAPAQHNHRVVNLDAGGGRRWAESDYDFGDEPEEEGIYDVWCCYHRFEPFVTPADDGIDRGDLDRMECNRCFVKIVARHKQLTFEPPSLKIAVPKKPRGRPLGSVRAADVVMEDVPLAKQAQVVEEKEAQECLGCRLLLCPGCRDHYMGNAREEA